MKMIEVRAHRDDAWAEMEARYGKPDADYKLKVFFINPHSIEEIVPYTIKVKEKNEEFHCFGITMNNGQKHWNVISFKEVDIDFNHLPEYRDSLPEYK